VAQISVKARNSQGNDEQHLLTREIDFIPNDAFEHTTERDLRDVDVPLYRDEEQAAGTLNSEIFAATLRSAVRESRLLTFDGEQLLFKRLNFLRFRANANWLTLNPKRPAKKKVFEMERLLDAAASVREDLARANLRLVVSIALKLSISHDEFDEFVAEANGILLYAIDKFDYARGYRFSTYATHAVQRHLYRFIERRKKRASREFACEPDVMMNEVMVAANPDALVENEVTEATAAVMAKIDQTLDERERFIIRGRFGLDGTGEGKTYSHLAGKLGLSKERARQLFQRGIEKLGDVARPFETTLAPS
jgi:RNA polymerase primary sigma factor